VKINQYCSVCKQHLDMEVIPTDDAGDDGVIWLRCPECRGFLPKFSGESFKPQPPGPATAGPTPVTDDDEQDRDAAAPAQRRSSPAEKRGRRSDSEVPQPVTDGIGAAGDADLDDADLDEAAAPAKDKDPALAGEPVAEYAAQLEAADLASARPYRSTDTYSLGDVIHHLAYGDVGVVVAKEQLPGGRQAVKVYFEKAGVVRLIEQAADGS
jgi:hypothetical protein